MKFIRAFLVFLMMYRYGFYFTRNTHPNPKGGHWGFFHFNEKNEPALFDIDFDFDKKGYGYYRVHGNNFQMDALKRENIASCEFELVFLSLA